MNGACAEIVGTTITANVTLTAAQAGFYLINDNGGAVAVLLPAASRGMHFKFMVNHTLSHAVTITATAAVVTGIVGSSDGTAVNAIAGKTNVILGTAMVVGDLIDLYCYDGTNFIVSGQVAVHTAVTNS